MKNLWLIKLDQTVTLSFPSVVIFMKLRGVCGPSPGRVYYRAVLLFGSRVGTVQEGGIGKR